MIQTWRVDCDTGGCDEALGFPGSLTAEQTRDFVRGRGWYVKDIGLITMTLCPKHNPVA